MTDRITAPQVELILKRRWARFCITGGGYIDWKTAPQLYRENSDRNAWDDVCKADPNTILFPPHIEKIAVDTGIRVPQASYISVIQVDDEPSFNGFSGLIATIYGDHLRDNQGEAGMYLHWAYEVDNPQITAQILPHLKNHLNMQYPVLLALMDSVAHKTKGKTAPVEGSYALPDPLEELMAAMSNCQLPEPIIKAQARAAAARKKAEADALAAASGITPKKRRWRFGRSPS